MPEEKPIGSIAQQMEAEIKHIEELQARLASYESVETKRSESEVMRKAALANGITEHEIAFKLVDREVIEEKGYNAAFAQLASHYDFLTVPKGRPKQIGGGSTYEEPRKAPKENSFTEYMKKHYGK